MNNKEFFIQTWQNEMQHTLSALNGLPTDMQKLDYRCNGKARSANELIGHFLSHAEAMSNATESFIANEQTGKKFDSIAEAVTYFEKHANDLVRKLKQVDEKTWEEQIVDFQVNGNKLFDNTMCNLFWSFMFEIIHHRGQLSTYYRHMGVRNPNIYGPTAEDMEAMAAAAH